MTDIEVMPVADYNARQASRYSEACRKWEPSRGGFPQAAFYFFCTSRGEKRARGYVAINGNVQWWAKTKREAIARVTPKV